MSIIGNIPASHSSINLKSLLVPKDRNKAIGAICPPVIRNYTLLIIISAKSAISYTVCHTECLKNINVT